MPYKSPLHEMSETTPTQFWNDDCLPANISFAMEHGGVGATSNPVIVGQVLASNLESYKPLIQKLIAENPTHSEDEIAWLVNEALAVEAAKTLYPVFEASDGKAGYVSIQTNTKFYNNAEKTTQQAVYFSKLAKNMMVKMPVTQAGVKAVEEATYHGVNVNATVSFSVPQAIAVAEAVERGLDRRKAKGLENSHLHPVCTIMVGRIDDWIAEVANKQGIIVDPEAIIMSGVAVFKNAYKIFKARGYTTRLLSAACRHYHWSELIGGEVSQTIPAQWIKRFANSDVTVKNRIDTPVNPALIVQLTKRFQDFVKAYEPEGMNVAEFDSFGPTVKTLTQFLDGYDKMVAIVRGLMVK